MQAVRFTIATIVYGSMAVAILSFAALMANPYNQYWQVGYCIGTLFVGAELYTKYNQWVLKKLKERPMSRLEQEKRRRQYAGWALVASLIYLLVFMLLPIGQGGIMLGISPFLGVVLCKR